MSNPLVRILVKAIRDAGNANGAPIAGYLHPETQIKYYQWRSRDVNEILLLALNQCPPEVLEETK